MNERGYMLIEASAAYVILVFGIVSLMPLFVLAMKANERSRETLKCAELAHALMEEIKLRRWDPNSAGIAFPVTNAAATLGPASGETASNKATFKDIGGFNGWSEAPPRDPLNKRMTGFGDYSRTVTVQYVTSSFNVSASTTSYKLVTVCADKTGIARACLNWLATNY